MVGTTDRSGDAARPRRTLTAVAKKAVASVAAAVSPTKKAAGQPAAVAVVPVKAPAKVAAKTATVVKAAPVKTAVKAAPAKVAPVKTAAVKATPVKAAAVKTAAVKAAAKTPAVKAAPAEAVEVAAAPAKAAAKTAAKAPAKVAAKAPAKTAVRRGGKGPFELPPVREGEEPWTAAELAELRTELEEQAEELRGEIDQAEIAWHELQRDSGDGAGDDQADAGTKTFEREHELSLANNSRDLLAQVDRALSRLDNGTYGVCENCGQPVGKARLQAFPRATLCVTCKQREERR